ACRTRGAQGGWPALALRAVHLRLASRIQQGRAAAGATWRRKWPDQGAATPADEPCVIVGAEATPAGETDGGENRVGECGGQGHRTSFRAEVGVCYGALPWLDVSSAASGRFSSAARIASSGASLPHQRSNAAAPWRSRTSVPSRAGR